MMLKCTCLPQSFYYLRSRVAECARQALSALTHSCEVHQGSVGDWEVL